MRLKLQELQKEDVQAQMSRVEFGREKIEGVLHHQVLLFVPKIISQHHHDLLAGHFRIKETHELSAGNTTERSSAKTSKLMSPVTFV